MPYFRILGFYIHWLHPVLINVKLSAAIIRTSRHKQTWESVCIHFSRLSINFRRAISHHAACCHVVSVIVRNEIIEMFPSSINTFPDFFFIKLHAQCYFDWDFVEANERNICLGVHMLIGLFISQAVSRPSVCHFASLDIFRGVECFMHFLGGFSIYLFIYLFYSFSPWSASIATMPQFINNVFIYHENLFWN